MQQRCMQSAVLLLPKLALSQALLITNRKASEENDCVTLQDNPCLLLFIHRSNLSTHCAVHTTQYMSCEHRPQPAWQSCNRPAAAGACWRPQLQLVSNAHGKDVHVEGCRKSA